MISASSAFTAANAALAKKPIWLLDIAGYSKAFASVNGLGSVNSIPPDFLVQSAFATYIGAAPTSGSLTLTRATAPGNILFAFLITEFGSNPSISDTAGNAWSSLFLNVVPITASFLNVSIFRAVAVASPAGNVVTFTLGTGSYSVASFIVIEVPAAYSGSLTAHFSGNTANPSATTTDGNTLNVPLVGADNVDLFQISLAPASGPNPGLSIGFLVATSPPSQLADPAQLLAPTKALSYFDAVVAGSGTLSTIEDWLVSIDDLKITVSDLDGGADLADLTFTLQDKTQQLTADLASVVLEGKRCRLRAGYVGMSLTDYATLFTGQLDTVESANGNQEYAFTASDVNVKKLTQKIYTVGDDGFSIDSKHPKTLSGHPLDILVDALRQAGVHSIEIDTAKIDFYRDTVYSGLEYVFTLTAAPTAKDFIENELMKPLGMYLWPNNFGLVSVNAFYPALSGNANYTPPAPPAMTLDTTNVTLPIPLEQEADLVNQVVFQFDDDGSGNGNFLAEEIVDYDASISKYGLVGEQDIQSKGMRSAFQGYFMAAFVGRLIALRYGLKPIVLDPLTCLWSACLLEPGDIVAVTNPFLPNRAAGTLGLTAQFFEVMDRNWKFMSGGVELKLLAINLTLYKQYLITPNAEAAYASASSADKAKYMFQCGTNGEYSTSAPANTLG